jgi:hypothetical protein
MKTPLGNFSQDSLGLWHYQSDIQENLGLVLLATIDALKFKQCSPAWFWFKQTPVLIREDDTPLTLAKRWFAQRQVWVTQNPTILSLLQQDAGIKD